MANLGFLAQRLKNSMQEEEFLLQLIFINGCKNTEGLSERVTVIMNMHRIESTRITICDSFAFTCSNQSSIFVQYEKIILQARSPA